MKVKVKIKDVLFRTDKATLFLISEKEVWLPNAVFKHGKGNYIVLSKEFAEQKGLNYKPFLHVPEKIEPVYNQGVIDELKYE